MQTLNLKSLCIYCAATVCVDCGTNNTSIFLESCDKCDSCKGLCICDGCISQRTGVAAGNKYGCDIEKCPHCLGRFCSNGDNGICWCAGCECRHHREGNEGRCVTYRCHESDCEDHEGNFQDIARTNGGDKRPWGEAKLGTELWSKARDGGVSYLIDVIEQGGVFSPIQFRSHQPQRVCMEVLVEHALSESKREVLKTYIQSTLSDYSVCSCNLKEYITTALGRVVNSGTPHITRMILAYLVHAKKESRDQVHAYVRILEWYDLESDSVDELED